MPFKGRYISLLIPDFLPLRSPAVATAACVAADEVMVEKETGGVHVLPENLVWSILVIVGFDSKREAVVRCQGIIFLQHKSDLLIVDILLSELPSNGSLCVDVLQFSF